jgi:hypothetical protein
LFHGRGLFEFVDAQHQRKMRRQLIVGALPQHRVDDRFERVRRSLRRCEGGYHHRADRHDRPSSLSVDSAHHNAPLTVIEVHYSGIEP